MPRPSKFNLMSSGLTTTLRLEVRSTNVALTNSLRLLNQIVMNTYSQQHVRPAGARHRQVELRRHEFTVSQLNRSLEHHTGIDLSLRHSFEIGSLSMTASDNCFLLNRSIFDDHIFDLLSLLI